MPDQNIHILIGEQLSDPLRERLEACGTRIHLYAASQLEEDPPLRRKIQIVYGNWPGEWWSDAECLKWIQVASAGIEHLDSEPFTSRGVILTNASGVHAAPIAEQMFGMVLMHLRRLNEAWDYQKLGRWSRDRLVPGASLLSGKTLGVLGVGAIGRHAARLGEAFGMRVVGCRRTAAPEPHVSHMYTHETRLQFFAEADVIMNTLPLTEKTRGLVGPTEFSAMKPGTLLVNAGRGATVQTSALVEALRSGRLGGAMLDVVDPEPLPEGHPLWSMPHVIITPHCGGWRPDYYEQAGKIFIENVQRWLAGQPLMNLIDLDEGY